MSADQRTAWLGAIIAAEGHRGETKTTVYQNDGPVADAIELAIYLSGYRPGRSKMKDRNAWAITLAAPHIGGPDRLSFTEPAGLEDVWCVTTGLGTWTAMQNGHVFLTGNSGGNAKAINNWDSNAKAGIPSKGLLQVIDPTFNAYHVPGTANNIWDPLANIAAAINYAYHRYGPALMRGSMGLGSGHGYAKGGPINEPVTGIGMLSGELYTFGEQGREWVVPEPRGGAPAPGGGGGAMPAGLAAALTRLADTLDEAPERIGDATARALDGVARHAAVGAQWSTR